MKDTVYLVVTNRKVDRMTKNLPELYRGEYPVKLEVTVEDSAFREPIIVREVNVVDWREGIDIADVEFKESSITVEEAMMIRQQRLERMRTILEQQGYQIIAPEKEEEEAANA